jgi:TolA-binding protein
MVNAQRKLPNDGWPTCVRKEEKRQAKAGINLMFTELRTHWKPLFSRFVGCTATIALGVLSANGQQSDQLQQQLQQLKEQYNTTTRDLEQRIAALEQQIKEQKEAKEKQGTISASRARGGADGKICSRTVR